MASWPVIGKPAPKECNTFHNEMVDYWIQSSKMEGANLDNLSSGYFRDFPVPYYSPCASPHPEQEGQRS
jgi:hypothetical protein